MKGRIKGSTSEKGDQTKFALKTSERRKMTSKSEETQQWIHLVAKNKDLDQRKAEAIKSVYLGRQKFIKLAPRNRREESQELATGHQKFTN